MGQSISSIIQRAAESAAITKDEIVFLLQSDKDSDQELFLMADRVRRHSVGNEVHLRGLIEFSNFCQRQCLYCGLRKGNCCLARYRMTAEEIYSCALDAWQLGYRTVVLQSGEDDHFDAESIAKIVFDIKALGIAVTLSCGERPYEEYQLWRDAGADRYLLKHEAAIPTLYSKLHPGADFNNRVRCLYDLRQGLEELAEDLLFMQGLDVEMAGIGPFIPHPQTPLARCPGGTVDITLKMVALARLMMPWTHLPATTALETIDGDGRQKALRVGANVVMPNLTPKRYQNLYEIYPDKANPLDDLQGYRRYISGVIASMGRRVAVSQGHSLKSQFMSQV